MNRQEIENMFDEQFVSLSNWIEKRGIVGTKQAIKNFIFETVIPEVLKSILPKYEQYPDANISKMIIGISGEDGLKNIKNVTDKQNEKVNEIKQKAKQLYNITL